MRGLSILLVFLAMPGWAQGFQSVDEEDRFVALIAGKVLTRTGITLDVSQDGRIQGRAFGRAVRGSWQWQAGYFCRDLYWGQRPLGYNCQAVRVDGSVLRFVSDRGQGPFADLKLR